MCQWNFRLCCGRAEELPMFLADFGAPALAEDTKKARRMCCAVAGRSCATADCLCLSFACRQAASNPSCTFPRILHSLQTFIGRCNARLLVLRQVFRPQRPPAVSGAHSSYSDHNLTIVAVPSQPQIGNRPRIGTSSRGLQHIHICTYWDLHQHNGSACIRRHCR